MVNKLRLWLDECAKEHAACPRLSANTLPQRVLEIRDENTGIRLHQSHQNETGSYAALSYCWGKNAQQLMTTRANIHEHMVTVPQERLRQTIQDAVKVCRVMGINYLWIDALCIIQDDDNDKLEQIANMGSIYKHSLVTLVAASAESVMDGFLAESKPRPNLWGGSSLHNRPLAELSMHVDNGTSGTIFLRADDSDIIYSADEPVFRRGWTFQELLLSPRVITFDNSQITLKCRETAFRPVFDTHLNFDYGCFDLPASVFGLQTDLDLHPGRTQDERPVQRRLHNDQEKVWRSIIEEYSRRDLTYFGDRLPGLAGMVSELRHVWGDTYLVGFWEKCIIQHLGWFQSSSGVGFEPFQDMDRSQYIGLPTWSWVTAPYRVVVNEISYPDARLVNSSVQPVSSKSPFGQVQSAIITLEARVLNHSELQQQLGLWHLKTSTRMCRDQIGLDYDSAEPELSRCKLLYLGKGGMGGSVFLIVKQRPKDVWTRIGCAVLTDSIFRNEALQSVSRTTIKIE